MSNPFPYHKRPSSPAEWQSNANHATYNRMGADADLAEFDRAGVRAPRDVIADALTSRWVEKEQIRLARKARRESST